MCEFVMRVRIALVAGCVACLGAIINTVGSFPCVQVKRGKVCVLLLKDSLRKSKELLYLLLFNLPSALLCMPMWHIQGWTMPRSES